MRRSPPQPGQYALDWVQRAASGVEGHMVAVTGEPPSVGVLEVALVVVATQPAWDASLAGLMAAAAVLNS